MGKAPETIVDLFLSGVHAHPSPKLLNYKAKDGRWVSISSNEAARRVRAIALGLYSLGIHPGDRVALVSENKPEWVLADFGILSMGGIVVPIYTTQSLPQIEFIFSETQPKGILISSRALYDRMLSSLMKLGIEKKIVIFEPNLAASDCISFPYVEEVGEVMNKERPFLYDQLCERIKPDDIATIVYTSSESGQLKGVLLTHHNMVSNILASESLVPFEAARDIALSYLPLSHVFERAMMFRYLHAQVPVYFAENIDRMPDYLMEVRPTVMATVPRFLEKAEERMLARMKKMSFVGNFLVALAMYVARRTDPEKPLSILDRLLSAIAKSIVFPRWRARFGGRFRFMIAGGAKLMPDIQRMFTAVGIPVYQGYGLTETSPIVAVNIPDKNRIGSVGPVLPGVEIKIAEDGEILVKGPNVTQGYYKNKEATLRAFVDGWFKTGDMGYLDPDQFLFVTDRKKDLFKTSGGKFIAPQAIENLLRASPYVRLAAVVGDGRKFASALILPNFQLLHEYAANNQIQTKSDEELVKHPTVRKFYEKIVHDTNKHLAHWETIKKFSLIADSSLMKEIPENTTKAFRKTIEQKYRKVIDAFYLHEHPAL